MSTQQFNTVDVLRLEIEDDPTGLANHVPNPSGDLGAWGWTTPQANVLVTAGTLAGESVLSLKTLTAQSFLAQTEYIPVTPGKHVAGRVDVEALTPGLSMIVSIFFYDAALNSVGSQGGAGTTTPATVWVPSMVAPAGAAFARLVVNFLPSPTPPSGSEIKFNKAMMTMTSTAPPTNFPYSAPETYLNVIGPTVDLEINRQSLDLGTLSGNIRDATLDPSQSDLIRPGRRVRLRVDTGTGWADLFTGKASEAEVTYQLKDPNLPTQKQAKIDLGAVDPASTLANHKRAEGVATLADLPAVLEGCGVPWNVNGSGDQVTTATVVAVNENNSALDQVAITRDSVHGIAWVDRRGVLNAWEAATYDAAVPVAATLTETEYTDLDLSYSTQDCINEVTVTFLRYNPITRETVEIGYGPYRDQASINTWGAYSADFTVQGLTEDPATIETFANEVLEANATPQLRINSVTLALQTQAELAAYALLDLGNRVRITNTAKGLDQTLRISGLTHKISGTKWFLTLTFDRVDSVAAPTFTPPVQNTPPAASGPTLQAGTADITASNGSGSVNVTFNTPFDAEPVVTPAASIGGWVAACTAVSETGCTLYVVHRSGTTSRTVPVFWIAAMPGVTP